MGSLDCEEGELCVVSPSARLPFILRSESTFRRPVNMILSFRSGKQIETLDAPSQSFSLLPPFLTHHDSKSTEHC